MSVFQFTLFIVKSVYSRSFCAIFSLGVMLLFAPRLIPTVYVPPRHEPSLSVRLFQNGNWTSHRGRGSGRKGPTPTMSTKTVALLSVLRSVKSQSVKPLTKKAHSSAVKGPYKPDGEIACYSDWWGLERRPFIRSSSPLPTGPRLKGLCRYFLCRVISTWTRTSGVLTFDPYPWDWGSTTVNVLLTLHVSGPSFRSLLSTLFPHHSPSL